MCGVGGGGGGGSLRQQASPTGENLLPLSSLLSRLTHNVKQGEMSGPLEGAIAYTIDSPKYV